VKILLIRDYCFQALVEQISYTPFAMVCFFFIMTLLEGKQIGEASAEVKVKFFPTYQVC
jgi:protein Mpv17